MRCKTLLMLITSIATVSLVASSSFGQCNHANGAGTRCANPNQSINGGTYFPAAEGAGFPTQPQPLDPALGPETAIETPFEPGSFDAWTGSENLLPSGETITVVIEHPSGAADITVRSFSDRNEAVQLVQQLNQRFWVAYMDSANQPGFREANSAVDINRIVTEIRAEGHGLTGITPVVARIALATDTSLEKLLDGDPAALPLSTTQDGDKDPSLESTTEEPAEASQLSAIEGIWSAVARSSNGELRTVELKLDSGGWARLTIPDGAGQTRSIERRAVIEDGQLKLQDGDQEMLLGQIEQVRSNQFVVTRDNGQVTFLKQ